MFLLFPLYFPDDWLSFLIRLSSLVEQALSTLMFAFLSFLYYTLSVLDSYCLVFELVVLLKKKKKATMAMLFAIR